MTKLLHILLADDDADDRFFFGLALKELAIQTRLTAVEDGEKLMTFLSSNSENLPQILFLDMNMPRKNGSECLAEIRNNKKLQNLPVVIYSTSMHEEMAELLYKKGAYYYICKSSVKELEKILEHILIQVAENNFIRPPKDQFILRMAEI